MSLMDPSKPRRTPFEQLLEGQDQIDPVLVGFDLARDMTPEFNWQADWNFLQQIAYRIRSQISDGEAPQSCLEQLAHEFSVVEKFQSNWDAFYDPRNSYPHEVLKRKFGIPLSLAMIYISLGRSVGLQLHGVNLPAHFLIRLDDERLDRPIWIDPTQPNRLLDPSDCESLYHQRTGRTQPLAPRFLEPCSSRTMVSRMLRNLKTAYQLQESHDQVISVLRRIVMLEPNSREDLRDLGLVALKWGRPGLACDAFGSLMNQVTEDSREYEPYLALLEQARAELRQSN